MNNDSKHEPADRQGHSALRCKDGKLEKFDPHPAAPQPVAGEGPDTGIANLCEALSDKSWLPFPGEGTPKLEEAVHSILQRCGLTDNFRYVLPLGAKDFLTDILRPFITPASSPERVPDGYAYRYHDCIRMNHGEEVNGGKHIEAIPYFLLKPPATPACSTEKLRKLADWLKGWEIVGNAEANTALTVAIDQLFDPEENGQLLEMLATPASTGGGGA